MFRKPLPILQDMPYHIKKSIAGNLERYTDKMALQSFSRDFHRIIRDPEARVDNIRFSDHKDYITLQISQGRSDFDLSYHPTEFGCLIKKDSQDSGYLVKDQDYVQVALKDFQTFTGNPNMTLRYFDLSVLTPNVSRILPKLIPGKLKVNTFRMVYSGLQEEVLPVLAHLDPEVLDYLDLSVSEKAMVPAEKKELDQIVKLDQWRKLEILYLCGALSSIIPVEHCWHLRNLTVNLQSDLSQIRAFITNFYRSPTFERCDIKTSVEVSEMKKAIGDLLPWTKYPLNSFHLYYPQLKNNNGQRSDQPPLLDIVVRNGTIAVRKARKQE